MFIIILICQNFPALQNAEQWAKLHENSRNSKRMRIKIKVAKVLNGYLCRLSLFSEVDCSKFDIA
jgi:hypothetical protein